MRPAVWQGALLGGVAAVSGFAVLIAVRSWVQVTQEFFPERHPASVSVASAGISGLKSITFQDSSGATLRGWYAPSTNGAGVALLHGAGGNQASLLPEARALASSGFGVLAFDWPGHGESDGEVHWSQGEARALGAATDFLARQPDVDAQHLGALGFSMGGVVLARVASTEQRLRAVVFVGTPSDQVKQIEFENRRWGLLSQRPALWAAQRGGMRIYDYDQQPVDRIGSIAPRPVLIVNGTEDPTVPAFLARDLFDAAGDPKDVLLVDGAGHGGYQEAPGSTYLNRITTFFERTLLG